jgi:hypothetical protein
MRIKILSIAGLLNEEATHFSCDNHRVVDHNIVSTVAYWTDSGRRLAEKDMPLSDEQYSAWCELGEDDSDDPYFTQCHMTTLGLEAAPLPPAVESVPVVPPTPEEIAAQEAADKAERIANLQSSIADLQAQLAELE